jgi:hypothetical protein
MRRLLFVLTATLLIAPAVLAAATHDSIPDIEVSWILVKLNQRLETKTPADTYELNTPSPALNLVIAEEGIVSIDDALPVSIRAPKNPRALARHGLDRIYRFHVPNGADPHELIARFSSLPEVEYAEPDYILRPFETPDDPLFEFQWGLHQDSDADVDAPEAWDISTGQNETVITVVDSGIWNHVDLSTKLVGGYDLVDDDDDPDDCYGHGTQVASIAAASTNNTEGIAGACWNCRLMAVRVIDCAGQAPQSRVADGIVWAADAGSIIINLSLGYYNEGAGRTLLTAVAYAADSGAMMITAGGNDNVPELGYPSEYAETMTTGATNDEDWRAAPMCGNPANGSNYHPFLDFVAPGDDVFAARMGGGYGPNCGTSFASPLVAGLIGIMRSMNPSLGREEARHLLQSAADDEVGNPLEDTPGFDVYHGWGRVDMWTTLEALQSSLSLRVEGHTATRVFLDTVNPVADSYDFVRGDLTALAEDAIAVDLGRLSCLENDSADADTAGGHEDTETPLPGEGFFYLARFNGAPGAGSYGGSSANRDRRSLSRRESIVGAQQGARLGFRVASAGDVDGDGYDDVVIGEYLYDDPQTNAGAAYVYRGSSAGLAAIPDWSTSGGQAGAFLGNYVSSAGDVNGDGYDDVLIGALNYDNGQTDEGVVYAYLGSSVGLDTSAHWTREGDQGGAGFGFSLGAAGDVDNDGYDDVIVAARRHDNGHADEGRAYLYRGSSSGLQTTAAWTFEPNQGNAQVTGVASAGDVNNDGYDDIVVSSRLYDAGQTDEGRVYVFYGSATGPSVTPNATREIDVAGANFGFAVAGAGDVDGNGYDDILVGAHLYTNGESKEGAAFVYTGSLFGLSPTPSWSFESDQLQAHLGHTVSSAGDVNGDGYDDVLVGGGDHDGTRTGEGGVWLFLGSASGLSTTPAWEGQGRQTGALYGWSAASAGDLNGDGEDDVIVGAYKYDGNESDAGGAFVYYGPLSDWSGNDCVTTTP